MDNRLKRRLPYSEKAKDENQSRKSGETGDNISPSNNESLSQIEAEQVMVPLLSSADRLHGDSHRRSIQFSQGNQVYKEGVRNVPSKPETGEPPLNRKSSKDSNESQQRKDNLTVPLLMVSAPSQLELCPEKFDIVNKPTSEETFKADRVDKRVEVSRDLFHEPASSSASSRSNSNWETEESRRSSRTVLHPDVLRHRKWKLFYTAKSDAEKELTKVEVLKSYRLHIFVAIIFVITVVSVSLAWYYKNEADQKLYSSQAIFFDPRTRVLTLSDTLKVGNVQGLLGRDIPNWMLPLHCPIVQGGNPYYKECLWKNIANLRITYFHGSDVQCYNISWESLGPQYVPHDCFKVNTDQWYGPSNQSLNIFPIQGQFQFIPLNYTVSNNGLFSSVVDFYWLSSTGAAIALNEDNPIQVTYNISGSNQLCFTSNYSGPLYSESNSRNYPVMNYTLCKGPDPLKTHLYMQTLFAPASPVQYPDNTVLQNTHWSLKSLMNRENLTQEDVLSLASNLTDHGFKDAGIITLDGSWQTSHGNLDFDEDRFTNVTSMMSALKEDGYQLTLCVSPYFQYTSENFHMGITKSMFVKDAGGEVIGLTNFQGPAAVLDVFTDSGREFYTEKLQDLIDEYEITTYRLTYGQQSWLPYKPHFANISATPNMYRKTVTEVVGGLQASSLVVEHTSDSRQVTSLIPVVTGVKAMNDKTCLTGAIETAFTLGLMGYPFVMADGIRLEVLQNQEENTRPSRELYIRWLQLASLFPAYQYSIAPWEYDPEVVAIARNFSQLHNQFVLREMNSLELKEEVAKGAPIIRPVWWLDPQNETFHEMQIVDEFLIGNNWLVAPVLCDGITERDIYLPPGVWENEKMKDIVTIGPSTIRNYSVPLESVAVFKRKKVEGQKSKLEF